MTDDDHKRLRELAEAATPGPWESWRGGIRSETYDIIDDLGCSEKQDRDFIAAANPTAVITLLNRLDACKRGAADMVARVQEESFKHKTEGDLARAALEAMNREYEKLQQQLSSQTRLASSLSEQLEEMRRARDMACDALETWICGHGGYDKSQREDAVESVAALRSVGSPRGES